MPILIEGLTYVYAAGTPLEARAVSDVTLSIEDGELLGIIGPTGSGKTTLIQHLNGLLRPTQGRVVVDGVDLASSREALRAVRRKVGLIFQYPEQQLFEETVFEDVAFGPRNLGLGEAEVEARVKEALGQVGLGHELLKRSPFELSGGQMRRVAIAGVLAMKPKVLVLDEPTAGLDPRGRAEILGHLEALHGRLGLTVVLVSHSMRDVARLARRLVVMDRGRIVLSGTTREVFSRAEELERLGLKPPPMTSLMRRLRDRGRPVSLGVLTVEEARREILRVVRGERGN
ncbi:MAG: energy-coupling factor transporter ATPase [Acetobacteraceae bacterium]|nr:energy-coupling factor transporter ATPase [Acetobacteraceae bacterium]